MYIAHSRAFKLLCFGVPSEFSSEVCLCETTSELGMGLMFRILTKMC